MISSALLLWAELNFLSRGIVMSIYLINNIIVPLEEEADFRREALRALRCKGSDLLKVDIYRKSVDARKKRISG